MSFQEPEFLSGNRRNLDGNVKLGFNNGNGLNRLEVFCLNVLVSVLSALGQLAALLALAKRLRPEKAFARSTRVLLELKLKVSRANLTFAAVQTGEHGRDCA